MNGTYSPSLVTVSVLIAIFASYVALDLTNSVASVRGRSRKLWLAGGSLAMGSGIWSMHFVGMLAFRMPGMAIAYDLRLLFLSVVIAVAASALALLVVSRPVIVPLAHLAAALAMGVAIAGMHYTGMWGMRMSGGIQWNWTLVVTSVLIAIGASWIALWLAVRLRMDSSERAHWLRSGSAGVMGFAIAGMHYTAMAAARFIPGSRGALVIGSEDVVATGGLALGVTATTVLILVIAVVGSVINREFIRRSSLLEEVERLYSEAEQMAQRYRQLFDANPHPMWVYDPETLDFLAVNDTAVGRYGYSREEFLTRTVADLHLPEDRPALVRSTAERISGAETVSSWQHRKRDGSLIDVEVDARSIIYASKPARIALVHDVTERHRAEQELALRTAVLEAQTEAAPDGILVVDLADKIISSNRLYTEMWGIPEEVIASGSYEAALGSLLDKVSDPARYLEGVRHLQANPWQQSGEEIRLTDGRTLHRFSAPITSPDGSIRYGRICYFRDLTESKRAEAREKELIREYSDRVAAEAAQQRIAEILESITDAFFALDRQWCLTYVNQKAEALLRVPRNEVLGLNVWEMHPSLKDTPVYAELQRAMTERIPLEIEYPSRATPGAWFRLQVSPTEGGLAVYVRDITRRKQQELALDRMRSAVEASMDGICIVSRDGVFEYVNQAKVRLFGYDEARELVDQSWEIAYTPDEVVRLEEEILPLFALSGQWRGEVLAQRKDGSTFPDAVSMTRLKAGGWIAVDWDMSEKRQVEDELRRRAEMVRLLQVAATASNESVTLEQALQVVVEQVCDFAHLAAGHAYIADTTSGELIPTNIWCTARAEAAAPFRRATATTRLRPGQGLPGRVLARGEPLWVEDVTQDTNFPRAEAARAANLHAGLAFPVLAGNEVVAVLEFFAQERLRPDGLLLDTMANVGTQLGRVAERTRADAALRLAKEDADRANRAKSDFLSRMSHELRTPLNAILGFGQLLEAEASTSEDRESVDQILKAGRHLLGLIDEVLDLARIEAGGMSLSVEPVAVAEVARESLDMVRHLAAQQGISLRASDALASPRFVAADLQRLKQVLLNLLSNAIKYNRPGGAVTLSVAEVGTDRLRIEVRDTGFGIAADKLQRLFTPFERLDAERTGVEGTGLGLALSKGLVEAMGGSLGVESTSGQGSRFWVELPLVTRPEPQGGIGGDGAGADGRATGIAAGAAAVAAKHTHTVLFIEDNLANVRLMERLFLRKRPHVRLLVAMQGSRGLDLAREHRPGLVLLDLNLPDIGGDEVLRRLQQDPALRQIPVVMLSGDAMPHQVERLKAAGAKGYLTKPFDLAELLRTVDDALRDALGRAGREPDTPNAS